jgi:hypothetical protein
MTPRPGSTSSFQQKRFTEAVILIAGSGSRLRGDGETFLKPLVPILGYSFAHSKFLNTSSVRNNAAIAASPMASG